MDQKRHGGTIDISAYDVDVEATNSTSPDSKSSSDRLPSAPEPPRWRFVNEAKKSLGYSSIHAGSYIKGKSSEELGAKYVAPDISLYQHKKEEVQPKKVSFSLHSSDSLHKDDVDVGKLNVNVPPQDAFDNGTNEVGKISIRSAGSSTTDLPSGDFKGLPKSKSQSDPSRNPFKQWDANYRVGPKDGRKHEWYDGKVHDSYKIPGSEGSNKMPTKVGKLSFHGRGSGDESFAGEVPRSSRDGTNNGQGDDVGSVDSNGIAREGALFIHRDGCTAHDQINEDTKTTMIQQNGEVSKKKKHSWLYLLLLLLLALIVILGVLLGTRNDEEQVAAASVGGIILPPMLVVDNSTNVPSSSPTESVYPTVAPTTQCPVDMKPFSIMHLRQDDSSQAASSSESTWRIKDACSGEIVARCLPCSLASFFQPEPDSEDSSLFESNKGEPTRRRSEGDRLGNTTECIPADNEYVLEIVPADEAAPCCGFHPATSIISYDNVVVSYGASSESRHDMMYFGEKETPCKSDTPSLSPTVEETVLPTKRRPTPQPTCSTEKEFNLCLAVDMSGSVCNDGSGAECSGCRASFLPMFFSSSCRDSFVDEDTCCNNFANVKEFSGIMVNLLGDFQADKSFSVVQFSTSAEVVSGLSSVEQVSQVINQFDYTGGLTNHESAIQKCQQTLEDSPSSDRKNFIMLVTDGVSSEPGFDPEGAAERAASVAKSAGTFIIPVFISPNGNDPSALAFMRRLSSDGKVFDVTDFGSLTSLQDRLVDQVSCS